MEQIEPTELTEARAKTSQLEILSFEQRYDSVVHEIEKRRRKWTLTSTPFDDISQVILSRIYLNYHTFKPSQGLFIHWVNRVITNIIKNALRDLHFIHSRPCLHGKGGCVFNTGNDTCSQTPSGRQCGQCLAYKLWESRKKSHNAIEQTLPLENHIREVDARPSEGNINFDYAKLVIEREIQKKLNHHEWKLYKLLYIQNKEEREVGKLMKYKPSKRMYPGYLTILKFKKKVAFLAREIIRDENLA
jgi:DNA-directed RNA polymerase specialized sigma24 family protein